MTQKNKIQNIVIYPAHPCKSAKIFFTTSQDLSIFLIKNQQKENGNYMDG
jgi:hypothetical protein